MKKEMCRLISSGELRAAVISYTLSILFVVSDMKTVSYIILDPICCLLDLLSFLQNVYLSTLLSLSLKLKHRIVKAKYLLIQDVCLPSAYAHSRL